ncbi:MAG TPA: thiamine pyrophosphate-binding protein, partial [Actinomycetota bacterium]
METIRLTTAGAIVRYLIAQRTELDGNELPLFPGVFAIFGHGNVTCLGEALEGVRDQLPTWRGQNEQSMAMAAIAFAKAKRRRQIMVATSSIGPGALNMVTAAGIAHANRLPVLLLSGDTFVNRVPDPVLQQVEPFGDPSVTVNDAFRPVTRYWDRIAHPAQLLQSLPQAVATMLDPADCGPAFLALPQDVQAEAYDFPAAFFEPRVHRIRRPGPDPAELTHAAEVLRSADRPLLIAGGGVHYSLATEALAAFAGRHGVPVVETVAGKSSLPWDHPLFAGPIGVTGSSSANALAAEADVVLAVGTRLQDFTTGSWSVFGDERLRLIALNAARHDVAKHLAVPLVADARRGLQELDAALSDWRSPNDWRARATREYAAWNDTLDEAAAAPTTSGLPSYAAVIRR